MKNIHFPLRVTVYDADGVQRNVANVQDIIDLAKEYADRYNDDNAKRFVEEATNFLTPITVQGATETPPAEAKAKTRPLVPDATNTKPEKAKEPDSPPAAKAPPVKKATPAEKSKAQAKAARSSSRRA